jgi:hypothetical protein
MGSIKEEEAFLVDVSGCTTREEGERRASLGILAGEGVHPEKRVESAHDAALVELEAAATGPACSCVVE